MNVGEYLVSKKYLYKYLNLLDNPLFNPKFELFTIFFFFIN